MIDTVANRPQDPVIGESRTFGKLQKIFFCGTSIAIGWNRILILLLKPFTSVPE